MLLTTYLTDYIDMGTVSATVNMLSGLFCIATMQVVTRDWTFKTLIGRVKLAHRVTWAFLAMMLFYSAGYTIENDTDPRMVDFLTQMAFFIAIAFSSLRHAMVKRAEGRGHTPPHSEIII